MSFEEEFSKWKRDFSWEKVLDKLNAMSEKEVREMYRRYLGDDSRLSTDEVRRRYFKLFTTTFKKLSEDYAKDPDCVLKTFIEVFNERFGS